MIEPAEYLLQQPSRGAGAQRASAAQALSPETASDPAHDPAPAISAWLEANRQKFAQRERPFVTLCYAQSLDGSIALRPGEPLLLSGGPASVLTHRLRSFHDGILVGIGTVLSDDPQLSVRHCAGADPQPIVLDSALRMPRKARLCCQPDKRCWVLTTLDSTADKAPGERGSSEQSTADAGIEIMALESDLDGRVCLGKALSMLKEKGIGSLMVEGGANVITAFLNAKLADAVVLTIAPRLVGGYQAVGKLKQGARFQAPSIAGLVSQPLGDDLIVWGNLRYNAAD